MGMDLSGAGGYFRWTISGWHKVLELAEAHGWEPTGTGPPRGTLAADWVGTYYSNDGQLFYARDAKKLADALEVALREMSPETDVDSPPENTEVSEGDEYDQVLKKFIHFCRQGSFRLD